MGSIDERLRSGLRANGAVWSPEIERPLEAVTRRARRRRLRSVVIPVAAAASVLAAVLAVRLVTQGSGDPGVPAATPSRTVSVVGDYERTVLPGQVPEPALTGGWRLSFRPDGVVRVTPPRGYGGVVSAVLYSIESEVLRTDLFGQDHCSGAGIGRYAVDRGAGTLSFTVVDDPCKTRQGFLTADVWKEVP